MDKAKISIIPALNDNYIYAIHSKSDQKNISIIDAGEAAPVIEFIKQNDLILKTIYITHHHFDHTNGIKELKEKYRCEVVGPDYEKAFIKRMDKTLKEGDHFEAGGVQYEIFHLPGHTSGHIGYHLPKEQIFFSGDTLFNLGCGGLFEGTAEEMWDSLKKIRTLPNDTDIYAGHEYTIANAHFVVSVLAQTKALMAFLEKAIHDLENGLSTYPTTVFEQKNFNPFFMADQEQFKALFGGGSSEETFKTLRQQKDDF